jgi:hypothetical protein
MAVFTETLHSWQNFYFMTGGAAAALLGLMFVALSLGQHLISDVTRASFPIVVTPSVVYFMSALLFSCVMLNPAYTPQGLALVVLVGGVFGLIQTLPSVWQLFKMARRNQDFDVGNWLSYIILPPISYVLMLSAALCLMIDQAALAFNALWLANIALLVCGVGSTWGLVLWIIDQPK